MIVVIIYCVHEAHLTKKGIIMTTHTTCPDCGTAVGQSHVNGCNIERCSACGDQRITCECEGHNPSESAWTSELSADRSESRGRRLPRESEGLEPIVGSGFVIGFESNINGPEAELVSFEPTRAELKTLAYHYLNRYFAVEAVFAMGQSGSFEIRESAYTWRRFTTITDKLSPGRPIKEFEEYIALKTAESQLIERCSVCGEEWIDCDCEDHDLSDSA